MSQGVILASCVALSTSYTKTRMMKFQAWVPTAAYVLTLLRHDSDEQKTNPSAVI